LIDCDGFKLPGKKFAHAGGKQPILSLAQQKIKIRHFCPVLSFSV
jgi:hypothetical protein